MLKSRPSNCLRPSPSSWLRVHACVYAACSFRQHQRHLEIGLGGPGLDDERREGELEQVVRGRCADGLDDESGDRLRVEGESPDDVRDLALDEHFSLSSRCGDVSNFHTQV